MLRTLQIKRAARKQDFFLGIRCRMFPAVPSNLKSTSANICEYAQLNASFPIHSSPSYTRC